MATGGRGGGLFSGVAGLAPRTGKASPWVPQVDAMRVGLQSLTSTSASTGVTYSNRCSNAYSTCCATKPEALPVETTSTDMPVDSFRRPTASEFIVPYWKFLKSLNRPFCIGMRFKIQYRSQDVNERRSRMITGINEVDPIRWTGSKWKSLLVRWEDGTDCNSQNRPSPWEIEIVGGSVSISQFLSKSSSKGTKLCPRGNLDVSK
ncbi:auxin response factor 3-like [Triticum aestivum]|uniref:auxin response factor 3-like n=1 Tax=Triticum aestivum TaxID=4565 RepID=UPI001D0247F8|nr:auxin response factor 3-like [Triticum aestivum]